MSAYTETLDFLLRLEVQAGWDLKLERMAAALALRGDPQRAFRTLHIAGTNGKGSTAAMTEAVLRAAGFRTGLYTSPHLVDFRERIRAGGCTIPEADVVGIVAELRQVLATHAIALTHFEFATLLAFEWFARVGVQVAVVEVGLGGRLDATNVVLPVATAITSVAFDHEEWLGDTLASIAGEKAGIVKTRVPLALGRLSPEAAAVVLARAGELGAPVRRAGIEATLDAEPDGLVFRARDRRWDRLAIGLPGAFQRANAEVALSLLSLVQDTLPTPVDAVRAGLADVRWPGRLAVLGERPLVVVDGAHNPAGIEALLRELPDLAAGRDVVLVFAVMADKAWRAMLERLIPRVTRAVVTCVGRRGLDPAAMADELRGRLPAAVERDPRRAVREAVAAATADEIVVVTGSLFLVGEAYAGLCGEQVGLFEAWGGW